MQENRTIYIILIGILVIEAGFFMLEQQQICLLQKVPVAESVVVPTLPEGSHSIILTDEGFSPSEVTIQKGDTVVFTTTTGKLFWPASNLHPSHTIYPEFDPQQPVKADTSWSFTFDKTGEWKFHDHLAPYFTGVITVIE